MKDKQAILLFGTLALGALVPAAAREQPYCSASSEPTPGCHGGCSMTAPGSCGGVCWAGGCDSSCMAFGPQDCRFLVKVHCPQAPPRSSNQPAAAEPPAGWALVRYELPATAPLDPRNVFIVSASSDAIARYAQTDSAKTESQAMADRIAADPSYYSDAAAAPLVLGWQTAFVVVPSGGCVSVRSRLASSNLPEERSEKPESVYFRATTDGEGRIASMEVLYTDASGPATERIVAFGRENLRAWSPDHPNLPLQVYGALRVTEGGGVGAGALAGSLLF